MKHEYGQFRSWNIVNETRGIKQSDKSFFNHNGSGVPAEICWFFDAEGIKNGSRREVIFNFGGREYKGHIERESSDMGRVRVFWESKLGAAFAPYNDENAYPQIQFEKVKKDSYNIMILNFEEKTDIDYIGVLTYLENNQEIPYSNPDATGLSEEKRKDLLVIKQRGQDAVAEMKKMAQQAGKIYGLDKCLPGSWLDGSNTKTRRYLWTQMKYLSDNANPISVSIFVEKGNRDKAYFRISLEIKNDGTDKAGMQQYHKHLELPQKNGLVYVAGSNEWGNPEVLEEEQTVVMSKVAGGGYKKVQICKIVEQKQGKTNNTR